MLLAPIVSGLAASLAAWPLCTAPSNLHPASPHPQGASSLLLNDSHLPESSSQNPQWMTLRTPHVW